MIKQKGKEKANPEMPYIRVTGNSSHQGQITTTSQTVESFNLSVILQVKKNTTKSGISVHFLP